MAFGYNYGGYPAAGGYYAPPMPDQLAQLRQGAYQQPMIGQGMQQPTAQAQMQNMMQFQQPNGGSGIIWVNGEKEVDDYLIAPNNAVALWDKNNPVVYVKQADATGKPYTEIYDLVKRRPVQIPLPEVTQPITIEDYATKEELKALSARIDAMAETMQSSAAKAKKSTKETEE